MTEVPREYSKLTEPYPGADPAAGAFLGLLEDDIATRPDRLKPFDDRLADRIEALVGGVEVNLDAALSPDDE